MILDSDEASYLFLHSAWPAYSESSQFQESGFFPRLPVSAARAARADVEYIGTDAEAAAWPGVTGGGQLHDTR